MMKQALKVFQVNGVVNPARWVQSPQEKILTEVEGTIDNLSVIRWEIVQVSAKC
jgi:hypothetical protein